MMLASKKRISSLVVLFLLFQIAFALILKQIERISGSSQMLDIWFHYTPQDAFELLQDYGRAGRNWYLLALSIDLFYPVVYVLLLRGIFKSLSQEGSYWVRFHWLPFAVALLDYLENLLEFRMVLGFPQAVRPAAAVCTWITGAKWMMVLVVLLVIGWQLVAHVLKPLLPDR